MDKASGNAFGFNGRHVAGDALGSGTSAFMMGVLFDACRVWTVGR